MRRLLQTATLVLAAVAGSAPRSALADDAKTAETPSKATQAHASDPVAVAAALKRVETTRVKSMSDNAGASDGTALDVARSTEASSNNEASSDLTTVHASTKPAAGVVAGTAREVRIDADIAVAPKVAASPRQLRHMNVERVVASLGPALMRCAEAAPPGKSGAGTAVISTQIGASGVVEETEVTSGGGLAEEVLACVEHRLEDAKFGRPGGASVVVAIRVSLGQTHAK